MSEQEDVKQEVPKVDGITESSPVEKAETTTNAVPETKEPQAPVEETPVNETVDEQPETKEEVSTETPTEEAPVSKDVPYERFKEVNDKLKLYESAEQVQVPSGDAPTDEKTNPQLDQDSSRAVQNLVAQQLERQKSLDFVRKNEKSLKDPLLAAAYRSETEAMMAKGEYVDYDKALTSAEKLLDSRLKRTVDKAKTEGVEEGKESVKSKLEAGAAGESVKTEEISDDKLTATEYAKKHGLRTV